MPSADANSIPNARTLVQANLLLYQINSWVVDIYPRTMINFVIDLLVMCNESVMHDGYS